MSNETDVLPISEVITVRAHTTIYKTAKWWCAVVLGEQYGRMKVFQYLWHYDEKVGKWKRKQKFTVGSKKNWDDIKPVVEEYLEKARL